MATGRCGAFLLCLKWDPNCCFHVLCRMETEEETTKQTNNRKKWVMIPPILSQLSESGTLGRCSPVLNSIPPKKDFPIFTLRRRGWSPWGKAPAPGRLVFPQICRPSREPKINMRKTTRINLAACAEKLGVSVIALSHMLLTTTKKGRSRRRRRRRRRRRKVAERHRVGDEETWGGKQGLTGGKWGLLTKVCDMSQHCDWGVRHKNHLTKIFSKLLWRHASNIWVLEGHCAVLEKKFKLRILIVTILMRQ